jgi:PAS domain-containing protein
LQTINAEQLARMDELSRTGNDLKNLLESTEVATLFLDKELRVRRFTAGANRLYKLIPSDVGRPLTDIVSILDFPDLAEVAAGVLNTQGPAERQALALDQHWYNVRIMPYRTQDNHIDGLVITFADVTPAKALETELRRTAEIYHLLLAHMTDAFAVCDLVRDPAGKVTAVTLQSFNAALLRLTGLDPRHLTGSPLFLALPALEPLWSTFQGQTGGEPLSGVFLPPGQSRPCQVLGYATGPHQFAFLFRETP